MAKGESTVLYFCLEIKVIAFLNCVLYTNVIHIFALLVLGFKNLVLMKICQCMVNRFKYIHPIPRMYKVMILHICHKWLQHPYITGVSFSSNGDKMYCTVDSQDGKIHNSCSVKQGKCITPLPCCDMHILHSHFMRALNPGRSKENTETDFHCWLSQCFVGSMLFAQGAEGSTASSKDKFC